MHSGWFMSLLLVSDRAKIVFFLKKMILQQKRFPPPPLGQNRDKTMDKVTVILLFCLNKFRMK